MARIEDVFELIESHTDQAVFAGPMPEEAIKEAEQQLGLTFPRSYRCFVKYYGSGGIGPEEFYGLTKGGGAGVPNAIWYTLDQRTYGLPSSMITISDSDDGALYCIDTHQATDDGEAPVVEYEPGLPREEQSLKPVYPTFADLALERLQDAIEWLEASSKDRM